MAKKEKLTKKPHEWQVDDPLRAKWLQSQTKAIKEIQDKITKGETETSDKLKAINTLPYIHSGNSIHTPVEYNETNLIQYRDHTD